METKNQLLKSKNIKSNKDFQHSLLLTIRKYNKEIQEKRKEMDYVFKIKKANEKKLNNLFYNLDYNNPRNKNIQTEIRILQKDIIAAKKIITQMLDEEAEIWKKIKCCEAEVSQILKIN